MKNDKLIQGLCQKIDELNDVIHKKNQEIEELYRRTEGPGKPELKNFPEQSFYDRSNSNIGI